jgi:1-deoxy-D-xylulose-5-phosphate reductoisomerase
MKKIAILGSTGSIGTQTLDIVRANDDLEVVALSCGKNIKLMEEQIREFSPEFVSVWDEKDAASLKTNIADLDVKVYSGMEGLSEVATARHAQMLITGIVGMVGIRPTIAAIKAGKTIALANKETLVTAGHIIMPLAKENNVQILPVDSEHSAIFQSLNGERHNKIDKILLTASGGTFLGKKREELKNIRPEDALKNPNWVMGNKVTIDSSTLINKGLEVMEAKWLFDVEPEQIQVIVHPQSIVHSMVQYEDGAVIAQLGVPDMRLPIQYAIYYPDRRYLGGDRLDFWQLKQLTFEKPDTDTFYGLKLAYQALKRGGNMPTVFNAANENAVPLFMQGKIAYLDIPALVQDCMEHISFKENPSLEEVLETEAEVNEYVAGRIS